MYRRNAAATRAKSQRRRVDIVGSKICIIAHSLAQTKHHHRNRIVGKCRDSLWPEAPVMVRMNNGGLNIDLSGDRIDLRVVVNREVKPRPGR